MLKDTDKIIRWTNQGVDYKTIAQRIEARPQTIISWLKRNNQPVHYRYTICARKNGHNIYFMTIKQASEYLKADHSSILSQLRRWNGYRTKENGVLKKVPAIGIKKMDKEDYVYIFGELFQAKDLLTESEYRW